MSPIQHVALFQGLEIMIKRSLLATSITMAIMQHAAATPLLPMDARGLAMGSTGVASAKLAHAPQYNPALLSTANDEDDFAMIFPQIGGVVADEDEIIESFNDLANEDYKNTEKPIIDHFDTILTNMGNILTDGPNSVEKQLNNLDDLLPSSIDPNNPNFDVSSLQTTSANLDASIANLQTQTDDLTLTTFDLTSELDHLSGSPLRGSLGVNGAIAIPSKTFAAAVSVSGSAYFSGRMFFTADDQALLNDYAGAIDDYASEVRDYTSATNALASTINNANTACTANPSSTACTNLIEQVDAQIVTTDKEFNDLNTFSKSSGNTTIIGTDNNGNLVIAEDPDLTSNVQVIAVGISEIGLTLSRNFEISGYDVAIGITPKLQTIKTFNYVASVEDKDIEEEDVTNTEQNFSDFNIDAGAAYQFGAYKEWQVGLVAKNLLSKEYKTESNAYGPTDSITGERQISTTKISLDTQFRAGLSHTTDWTVVAIDVDLMENDPVAFESATQYASIGAEFDVFDTLQLRAGYRVNLSAADASIASAGLGFSPFGVHLDFALMTNPSDWKKEVGAAAEFGFYF
jgi:hypothetical protein